MFETFGCHSWQIGAYLGEPLPSYKMEESAKVKARILMNIRLLEEKLTYEVGDEFRKNVLVLDERISNYCRRIEQSYRRLHSISLDLDVRSRIS